MIEEQLASALLEPLRMFLQPDARVYVGYLLIALVIAVATYFYYQRREKGPTSLGGLLRYLFPKGVWLHPSATLDYRYLFTLAVIRTFIVAHLVIPGAIFFSGTYSILTLLFGGPPTLEVSGAVVIAGYTAVLLLFSDFTRFYLHYLLHKVPFLWEFHKVHHSARVLTPLTLYRVHPVENLLYGIREAFATGVVTAVFSFLFDQQMTLVTILGVNAGRLVFNVIGSNLRHSHIWVSFGGVLEHFFISPAQHQIHHSAALEHRDKNLGSHYAIWDWMFGTLVLAGPRKPLTLGIGGGEDSNYDTQFKLLWIPIRNAVYRLFRQPRAEQTAK